MAPGVYFRALLIGFFEGIGSERGIAWRVSDSLSLQRFLKYGLAEATPDHVTISRTRRLIDEQTHQAVFTFVLGEVAKRGLLKGKTIGISRYGTSLHTGAVLAMKHFGLEPGKDVHIVEIGAGDWIVGRHVGGRNYDFINELRATQTPHHSRQHRPSPKINQHLARKASASDAGLDDSRDF